MQALDLVAKLFVEPGDAVVVEKPTFPGILSRFRAQGARLIPLPIDQDGLDVDKLASVMARETPRLIVVQPSGHNPTGTNLSIERRARLLALARQYNVPVIEDDAAGFFADDAGLRALRGDGDDIVIHVGSFSKLIAPGLRVGYLAGPANIIRLLTSVKQMADLHTSPIQQLLLEGWLLSYDVARHVATARRTYQGRLAAALQDLRFGPLKAVSFPRSGLYVFCRIEGGVPAGLLQQRSAEHGVVFAPGDAFSPDGDLGDHLRLCVSGLPVPSIHAGLRRLTHLLEEMTAPS